MDIALDCFPNTDCTTTCESIWMGVPVVTLRGKNYVSLMSTAVLQAAHLDEWIADSESYIAIAINQATRLSFLRSNRSFWRISLKVVLWVIHVIYLHPLKKHFLRCA